MEDYKDELKKLVEEIDYWFKKIREYSGGFSHYAKWLDDKNEGKSIIGYKKSSMETCRRDLKHIEENYPVPSFHFDSDDKVTRAKKFISLSNEYIKLLKNPLEDRIWFFYFLDIGESRLDKYPKLGRGLLKTFKNNQASLKIVPNGLSKVYDGEYHKLNEHVIYFDFSTPNHKKRLHIKVRFDDIENEIMLGGYSSFDRSRILSGSVLLEQITHQNLTSEAAEPILVSSIDDKEKFNAIDPAIRRYLTLKKKNYYKVSNTIPDKATLKRYVLKRDRPSVEHIENRFLEFQKPIIFLSTPQSGLSNSNAKIKQKNPILKEIIQNLKNDFQDFKIRYEDTNLANTKEIIHPFNNLKLLQQTRYFIIILTKTDKASFSLIQLGWAVAYCKHILIIYEDGVISDRLKALQQASMNIQRKKVSNIVEEKDAIYKEISTFILRHKLDKSQLEI